MTIIEIIVTILLGTAAGFINTFAGGGSMLVVPFLIFIGLPANVANATNRIAILLQNVVSVNGFKQKKILDFKTDSKLLLPVALGSIYCRGYQRRNIQKSHSRASDYYVFHVTLESGCLGKSKCGQGKNEKPVVTKRHLLFPGNLRWIYPNRYRVLLAGRVSSRMWL